MAATPETPANLVGPSAADREVRVLRCQVTRNPCGTDTWAEGQPCSCDNCQEWLRRREGR